MTAPGYKLGNDKKLFYDAVNSIAGTPTWVAAAIVEDVKRSAERATAELMNRESDYVKKKGGKKNIGHEVTATYKRGDAAYDAFRAAWDSGGTIAVFIADGAAAAVGTEGYQYDACVLSFPEEEPLQDFVKITFTLAPSADSSAEPQFVEVSA